MSQYSLHVNQFLENSLLPEIDKLNIQLASMEEFGYDSIAIVNTRIRVNKLLPVYDFLNEYVIGEEECDWVTLRNLMSATGLGILSNMSAQPIVNVPITASTQSSINYTDMENLAMYVDNKLYDGSRVKASTQHTITFMGTSDLDSMAINYNGVTTTYKRPVAKFVNITLAVGIHSFVVMLYKNGITTYTKTLTIQSE